MGKCEDPRDGKEGRGLSGKAESVSSLFLLAAVAYRFGDEGEAARLAKLAGRMTPSGMDRLTVNAAYHELEPLLHLIATDCSACDQPLELPPELAARWSQVHAREAARSTIIHYGAEKALSALAEAGVRAAPLKGFFLASESYEKKSARAFKDLDLLVEPDTLAQLNEALLGAGFQPASHRPAFVPAPAYTVYSLPLEGSDTAMEIDIHTGMHWPGEYESRTSFRSEDLWSYSSRHEVEGMPAWVLSPEHLIITTFLDVAVNHRYARLVKFRDILEILSGTEVDWAETEDWCRRWEVRSFVGPGLRYLDGMDSSLAIPSGTLDAMLPSYAAMKMFTRFLPVSALPDHRSRSFSLANLLFFVLADAPRERANGLLRLPGHMLRGRKRF